jgi:hypothetical protein
MQSSVADQKNKSGEGQDLRLYEKAAEVAYQYAKNKASKEAETSENKNEMMEQDNDQ